jgi:hypothetical protein
MPFKAGHWPERFCRLPCHGLGRTRTRTQSVGATVTVTGIIGVDDQTITCDRASNSPADCRPGFQVRRQLPSTRNPSHSRSLGKPLPARATVTAVGSTGAGARRRRRPAAVTGTVAAALAANRASERLGRRPGRPGSWLREPADVPLRQARGLGSTDSPGPAKRGFHVTVPARSRPRAGRQRPARAAA